MNQMNKFVFSLITTCIFLLIGFSGCTDSFDVPKLPSRGFFMGILPISGDGQNLEDAYIQASQHSEFVPIWESGTGADGFWDYAEKLKGWWGDTFVTKYIRGNGMFPLVHFSFIDKDVDGDFIVKTPSSLPDATLENPAWRSLYKLSVLDVINVVKPAYLSLGNEVNRWYEVFGINESNPNSFHHFVSLYNEIYDAVKEISPETKVFCVFSREIVDENREANLEVLNLFDSNKLDVLMFTTYPYAIASINTPSDIPEDYYKKAVDYMPGKSFGFSEIGWSSLDFFGGEKGQSDFLINLSNSLTIDQGINLHMFGYCWLHDLEGGDTTGLINRDLSEKLGYSAWKHISESMTLWYQQDNNQIVFMSRADSEEGELYLLNKEKGIIRLTYNDRHENNPALSFDGRKVAFHAGDPDNLLTWEIYVIDLETLEEIQLTDNNVLDGHPDWSPDGNHIVFGSFQDDQGNPAGVADLYVIDLNGTIVTQLTDNEWEDNDPEWSPDGKRIVFKSTRRTETDAREEIFVMDSDGTNVTQLTTTNGWESDHDPSWHPDSMSIAYMHYAGIRPWTDLVNLNNLINHWDELTPWNTYIVNLEGDSNQVTYTDYIAQLAVFSKKGEQILYLDNEFILNNNKLIGINHHFTIINQDGTVQHQLLPDDEHTPTVEYFDW